MSFRRTPEEIVKIQHTLSNVEFVGGESLTIDFLTRPEIVRALLPDELEPGERPRITAQVSRWRSNCVGDFGAAAIYVSARYGDIVADYVLTMFMDNDVPMLFGRDLFGEPKKIGSTALYRNDGHMTGSLDRNGARLIQIEADLEEDRGPSSMVGRNFNVKYQLAPDGSRIIESPLLTVAEFTHAVTVNKRAKAALTLGSTVHDPLGEIEIVEVLGGLYLETGIRAKCEIVAALDGDAFLPLALGRADYWPALATAHLSKR